MNTPQGLKQKRCTFAIISHPDAGKTTMTEKLLLYGGVIRSAGKVKSKSGQFAKSDWMELEKQRGISVTSSVMSFHYDERPMHLLDTPGHNDFSEDTYRTLTAVESTLMMIDSAKGVEAQTIKLMDVCRMRDTPIVTFMNKFDRESMDPFELIDNIEKVLSIQCVPFTWPIGEGVDFKGVYNLKDKQIIKFSQGQDSYNFETIDGSDLESDAVKNLLSESQLEKLQEDLEMIEELVSPFSYDEYLAGIQTPVFFGSALFHFGVKEVLDFLCDFAPGPKAREAKLPPFDAHASSEVITPEHKKFSGFVFKIQANMDKNHRDRMAFLRVCSGKFQRNQKIFNVREQKEIKISSPVIFQAQDRDIVETAYPGDIIGLHDNGKLQIGDTFTEGEKFLYTGVPQFAPEIFMRVLLKDPLKAKHLDKGLQQLSEEGAVQLFTKYNQTEKILGAVGMLQFDVVKFRLEQEYNVKGSYESVPLSGVRWLKFKDEKQKNQFISTYSATLLTDNKSRLCLAVKSDWDLKLIQEKNPEVQFFKTSDYQKAD